MAAVLEFRYTGGASNSDPNLSLGGTSSSVQLSTTALNNLFDDVSPAEASAGDTEYRAIDIYNSGDATATAISIYVDPETTSVDTQLDLGPDSVGSTLSIADESTAPTGITFGHYNATTKLSLPDVAAGSYVRVWVKRIVNAGATNLANDQATLNVEYA